MAETRYAKQPRLGEQLYLSPEEQWPILAVRDRGVSIDVRDRIGRDWTLTRADKGCWLVVRSGVAAR